MLINISYGQCPRCLPHDLDFDAKMWPTLLKKLISAFYFYPKEISLSYLSCLFLKVHQKGTFIENG